MQTTRDTYEDGTMFQGFHESLKEIFLIDYSKDKENKEVKKCSTPTFPAIF